MKPSLADQLKEVKLDPSSYSKMPIREDVIVMNMDIPDANKAILKQWEKLNMLRTHLQKLDRYIQTNNGESLNDWLKSKNTNLAPHVLEKIGSHNNQTGGISAYFYNLQDFYDKEERAYDEMEAKATMPDDLVRLVSEMRTARGIKNTERKNIRRIKVKDMKKDGKGFLVVEVEEPVKMAAADGSTSEPDAQASDKVKEAVKKTKSNVAIYIGGGLILTAAILIYANSEKK